MKHEDEAQSCIPNMEKKERKKSAVSWVRPCIRDTPSTILVIAILYLEELNWIIYLYFNTDDYKCY